MLCVGGLRAPHPGAITVSRQALRGDYSPPVAPREWGYCFANTPRAPLATNGFRSHSEGRFAPSDPRPTSLDVPQEKLARERHPGLRLFGRPHAPGHANSAWNRSASNRHAPAGACVRPAAARGPEMPLVFVPRLPSGSGRAGSGTCGARKVRDSSRAGPGTMLLPSTGAGFNPRSTGRRWPGLFEHQPPRASVPPIPNEWHPPQARMYTARRFPGCTHYR
jgi:hypothetical protein